MSRKNTLYITDLDGTLLNDRSEISERSAELLNRAIEEGCLFSIATARTPATVSEILRPLDFNLPAVVMTGAAFWDPSTGRYSHVEEMDSATALRVVEAYRKHEAAAFLYTLPPEPDQKTGMRKMLIYHFGELNNLELEFMNERLHSPFKHFEVPATGESSIPQTVGHTVLFFGIQPTDKARRVLAELKEIKGINPMFYHDRYGDEIAEIEAFPAGATKAKAIRKLAKECGADRLVVFGDNLNDLSMMREADLAVAVANAREEVKAEADIVIGPNTEDSVARFISED